MAAVFALIGVGIFVWAPIATSRAMVLVKRGKYAPVISAALATVRYTGACPISVAYRVGNQTFRTKQDMPVAYAKEVAASPSQSLVVYDPENPNRARILTPRIARLPDQDTRS
ncbi:MAG: hypothetical protein QM770_18845 [Tepidisphaeraceae bacterium]